MMIKVCKECGHEIKGCANCNPDCPVCGGEVEKLDYVTYMKAKENRNGSEERIQPDED